MPSGERIFHALMRFAGVREFTTVDFTGINLRDIKSGRGGGTFIGNVVEIPDNATQGLLHKKYDKWVNVIDNSDKDRPHAAIKDGNNKYLTSSLSQGDKFKIPDLGEAVVVYHGPGNKRRYQTR